MQGKGSRVFAKDPPAVEDWESMQPSLSANTARTRVSRPGCEHVVSSRCSRPVCARSVIVSDSGIGIPSDQLPRIFERFYRGETARSHAEGSGLGLPIARWIADLHGARIAVASDATGTRVEIAFPAA